MIARIWGILALVAIAALFIGGLLGGVSLILYRCGLISSQIAVAGVAEMLLSLVFLIAGVAISFAAVRTVRNRRERLLARLGHAALLAFCGVCWTIIGVRGIVWPELLRAAFGHGQ